jgi:integrase
VTPTQKLPELLKEWVAARQTDKLKPLRPRSFKTILFVSRRFDAVFGNVTLAELTPEKIESVFSGQSWSPQSLKNYRSYLSQLFNWCIRRGYATSNPVQHLQIATVHSTVEIYSLEQVKTIFAKLQEPEYVGLIPYFCLGLFAGVRPLEARRMAWENNIHLETGEVEIQGEISKTRRPRRFRMEPLLLSWLTWYRHAHPDVPLICPSFTRLYRSLQSRLDFKWIPDGLRHTFGTFHYNRDKSLGPLTFMMGNSESVARKHYLTILPQNDVDGYWKIKPPQSLG